MQLHVSTDYAIRILQYLHIHRKELPTAMTISQSIHVTYSFFIKIANQLKQEGLLDAVRGRNGGYRLARPASEISLHDVILAMEGKLQINRCLQDDEFCSRKTTKTCPVRKCLLSVQDGLIETLSQKSIADFAQ